MKNITINGEKFEYSIIDYTTAHVDYNCCTEFYQGMKIIYERKYCFFGKKLKKMIPNLKFKVYFNIENKHLTKEEVKKRLEHEIEIINREKEILRGEII
jgi:hypothetical protein